MQELAQLDYDKFKAPRPVSPVAAAAQERMQKAKAVFDPEHAIFEILAIDFNRCGIDMRTQRRGNAESSPEMCFGGHDLAETAEGGAGAGHEEAKLRGTAFERIEDLVTD